MAQVVDYSFARPAADLIRGSGFVGAVRYLSGGGSKDITHAEQRRLHDAGLAVGYVWETTASRSGEGPVAGTRDAQRANDQADGLGVPLDRPLYYATDFDATWAQVAPYYEAVRRAGRRPVGVYGSYRVIEGAAAAGFRWLWQCAAWSGNGAGSGGSLQGRRLSAHAHLFQRVGYVLGDTSDANDVLRDDWGGWHPHQPSTPPPSRPKDDDDMTFLVKDPDNDQAWWEVGFPYRRKVNMPFGYTGELDTLSYLASLGGQPTLGDETSADTRRFWINCRPPLPTVD